MKKNSTCVKNALQQVRDKYDIHDRPFTGRDFYRICKAENIHLVNKELIPEAERAAFRMRSVGGYLLTTADGSRLLYLRSFFVGRFDVATAFHELGHYFLDHGGNALLSLKDRDYDYENDPHEIEAELFSELATGRKIRGSK